MPRAAVWRTREGSSLIHSESEALRAREAAGVGPELKAQEPGALLSQGRGRGARQLTRWVVSKPNSPAPVRSPGAG